jgi:hypothetical protein
MVMYHLWHTVLYETIFRDVKNQAEEQWKAAGRLKS